MDPVAVIFLVMLSLAAIASLTIPRRDRHVRGRFVTRHMDFKERLDFWDSLPPEQLKRANELGLF